MNEKNMIKLEYYEWENKDEKDIIVAEKKFPLK